MLKRHAHTVAMLNRDRTIAYLVRDYFQLPRGVALMPALIDARLGQADLVLCLLHLYDRHHYRLTRAYIHLLVGRPISIGPPCLLRRPLVPFATIPPGPRTLLDRRITAVAPANPRRVRTAAHGRWDDFMVGRTVGQLLSRGSTRREVRRAVRRGWIVLEDA